MKPGGWVRLHRIAVVLLALVIVLAGAVGTWIWFATHEPTGPSTLDRADGPTLHQVLAGVNDSTRNTSGGPWALFSVYGIAAQVPFSPNLIGYAHTNATVNSCGQQFNGVTLWNGTIPTFKGTFNSGTAPFWQLAYFSNSSREILLATDVSGVVHIYAPIAFPGSCMPWYDFPGHTANWTNPTFLPEIDSSRAAAVAWDAVVQGQETVGSWIGANEPMVQIITFGPGVFEGLGDLFGGFGVYFERCGEVGIAGIQPLVSVGVNSTGQWTGTANLTTNCALLYSGHGAFDSEYDLVFSTPSVSVGPSTTTAAERFQVAIAAPNGTLGNFFDEVGLANWMISWNLTTLSGQHLPLATPTCRSWVHSLADCPANASGWFAVLMSASGEWIDSYGALANGSSGWSQAVTALVSHQQLVIVCPSSWSIAGDVLSVSSTVNNTHVIGSVAL